jgi:hypothetical protein
MAVVLLGVACQKQSSLCRGCITKTQMAFLGCSWAMAVQWLCNGSAISAHKPLAPRAECKVAVAKKAVSSLQDPIYVYASIGPGCCTSMHLDKLA